MNPLQLILYQLEVGSIAIRKGTQIFTLRPKNGQCSVQLPTYLPHELHELICTTMIYNCIITSGTIHP